MANTKLPPGWENKASYAKPNWAVQKTEQSKPQNKVIHSFIDDKKSENTLNAEKKVSGTQGPEIHKPKESTRSNERTTNKTSKNVSISKKIVVVLFTLLIILFFTASVFAILYFIKNKPNKSSASVSDRTSSVFSKTTANNDTADMETPTTEIATTEPNTIEPTTAETTITEPATTETTTTETTTTEPATTETATTEPTSTTASSSIFTEFDFIGFWYPESYGEDELTIYYVDSSTVSFSFCSYSVWSSKIVTATIEGSSAYFYDDMMEGILNFYDDSIGLFITNTSIPIFPSQYEIIFSDKRDYSLHEGEQFDYSEEETTHYDETTAYNDEIDSSINIVYDSSVNWENYSGAWSSDKVKHTHGNTTCYNAVLYLILYDDNSMYFSLKTCNGYSLSKYMSGVIYPDGDGTYSGSDYINMYYIEIGAFNGGIHMIITNKTNATWDTLDPYFDLKIE